MSRPRADLTSCSVLHRGVWLRKPVGVHMGGQGLQAPARALLPLARALQALTEAAKQDPALPSWPACSKPPLAKQIVSP